MNVLAGAPVRAERSSARAPIRVERHGPGYPPLLERIPDPPPELHVVGDPAALLAPAVAIVGTRRPSAEGLLFAEALARNLAARGLVVVSGLAYGIDAAAHRGALRSGRTVAVLASGVDVASPAGHAGLYREIAASGAVVSEFAPGDAARTWHFLRRNRVISGLALGTIVVEAGAKSGALITARHATEQDREVFAVPGSPLRETSAGPNALLRDGAALVRGWEDVLSELEPRIRDTWPEWSGHGPSDLFGEPLAARGRADRRRIRQEAGRIAGAFGATGAGDRALEHRLLAALGRGPLHVDELCAAAGGDIAAVLAVLSALELDGAVRQLPGKRFCRS